MFTVDVHVRRKRHVRAWGILRWVLLSGAPACVCVVGGGGGGGA
jgi:hypothetical protein